MQLVLRTVFRAQRQLALVVDRGDGAVKAVIGYNDLATDMYLGTLTNHTLEIRTNNTTKMTVLSGGNVGIGSTNPLQALDVLGQITYGTSVSSYRSTIRSDSIASIASAGTSDITVGGNQHGLFDIACNNTGLGNIQTAKLLRVAALGSSTSTVQTIGSDIIGSGGACAFTVTSPSNATLRITNSGACTGAVAMTCHWFLTSAQTD